MRDIIGNAIVFLLNSIEYIRNPNARKDFQKELVKKQTIIEAYRALVKEYLAILEAVFSRVESISAFIPPHEFLSRTYIDLLKVLKEYQRLDQLKDLPPFMFDDYVNLTVNAERMISNYPKKRQETLSYQEYIESLFIEECLLEGMLPDSLERSIKADYREIEEHLRNRGLLPTGSNLTIPFVKKRSHKKKIYQILWENKNKLVSRKYLKERVGIKYDDIRSFISQLRSDLIKHKINNIRIENVKNEGYRLIELASI